MAAAHVSGAVALFIDYYRDLPGTTGDPSPALVKAAFMPVAHDLEGFLDADGALMGHRPDSKQGWGRLNIPAIVAPADPVLYFDQTEIFDFTGQEWSRVITAANPAEPMRVMLVWTDAPGHGLGGITPAWNNDLDLVVEHDGSTYLGNDFGPDGFSTTGGLADTMNNAEGVFLPPVAGDVTLRVLAANINSNGVPQHGDDVDQDFALVCYNCALVPDFALSADPTTVDICAPGSGATTVEVEQLADFGDSVSLSVTGVPEGASESLTVNPVAPGGSSLLTLDPGAAIDSDSVVDIQGDSATLSRSISVGVRIRTVPPAPALLTVPATGAIDVPVLPALTWDPVPWADRYLVEIANDPDFLDIVYSAVEDGTTHVTSRMLAELAVYHWRVRATNACGFGDFSTASSFTTVAIPDLLLVDDDYDLPDEQNEYTSVLDGLGVSYEIWDVWAVENEKEPDATTLARYEQIIWWSGQEEIFPGPDADSELLLEDWLDAGSCLLISSADYTYQRMGISPFMQERLGVASVVEDSGMTEVTGQGSVFAGLGPYPLVNLNPDYRDSLSPDGTAELAFSGDLGDAGVNKDGGWYRTSYLGFGVESLGVADKPAVLGAFLTWCAGLPDVDGDADGALNGADCAPGDANAWAAPEPITDLTLGKGAVGFSWSEPVSGSGSTYDLLRSTDYTDFYNATCVVAGTEQTSAGEDEDPLPGQLFFYLVGATSDCGVSTLGVNLDGSPRYGTACDPETIWW
jgi:hypothetical protein